MAVSALGSVLDEARRGDFSGFSITLPLKEAVLPLLDAVTPLAREMGAVNCVLRRDDGTLEGHNTDGVGLAHALAQVHVSFQGTRVLLLGAGGAARAAAFTAQARGAARLWIANRGLARAQRLVEDVSPGAEALALADVASVLAQADVIINATRVGLGVPDASPLPPGCKLGKNQTVLDMVYQPLQTALLADAGRAGARTVDGLWMLIHQALEQLRLWTGVLAPPPTAAALHHHLSQGLP